MASEALDRFGRMLMQEVRDAAIVDWRMIIDGRMRSPRAHDVRRRLAGLGPEQQKIFLEMVPEIVDTAIYHVLWMFEDSEDIDIAVQTEDLRVESLREESDGLSGELFTEDGWIARFSAEGGGAWA